MMATLDDIQDSQCFCKSHRQSAGALVQGCHTDYLRAILQESQDRDIDLRQMPIVGNSKTYLFTHLTQLCRGKYWPRIDANERE